MIGFLLFHAILIVAFISPRNSSSTSEKDTNASLPEKICSKQESCQHENSILRNRTLTWKWL